MFRQYHHHHHRTIDYDDGDSNGSTVGARITCSRFVFIFVIVCSIISNIMFLRWQQRQ
jgi:hypothetical protein